MDVNLIRMRMMEVNLRRTRGMERMIEVRVRRRTAPPQGWPRSDACIGNISKDGDDCQLTIDNGDDNGDDDNGDEQPAENRPWGGRSTPWLVNLGQWRPRSASRKNIQMVVIHDHPSAISFFGIHTILHNILQFDTIITRY